MTFLDVWIGYTIFGTALFSAIFVWAVRARQFSDLDRARFIPLSDEEQESSNHKPGRIDRYTWVVLALLTVAAITMALVIGLRPNLWN